MSNQKISMAKEIKLKLKEGDKAPDFSADTSGGGRVSLADFKGKNVVFYFYPKDDTPGCTKEACAFRDAYDQFRKKGAVVLGVSIDPVRALEGTLPPRALRMVLEWAAAHQPELREN